MRPGRYLGEAPGGLPVQAVVVQHHPDPVGVQRPEHPIRKLQDELGEFSAVELRGVNIGTNYERFRAKARAYLRDHEDHVALQKLRRNRQLTATDLAALEQMLIDSEAGDQNDIARARQESEGFGLFVRSLVGLDRAAATEAFSRFLADTSFTASQIHFVGLIVEHLTENGLMAADRLYESPFTDTAPQGPEGLFTTTDINNIIEVLDTVRAHAIPEQSDVA